ncbi:hypothetical protein Tco_0962303 [Tanacetum coccineum]
MVEEVVPCLEWEKERLTQYVEWELFEGVKKGLRRVGAGSGKVNGGGVDLGVSKRLLLDVAREMIDKSGGIEVREVGGGAET